MLFLLLMVISRRPLGSLSWRVTKREIMRFSIFVIDYKGDHEVPYIKRVDVGNHEVPCYYICLWIRLLSPYLGGGAYPPWGWPLHR